jgi:hypothetical protein
LDVGRGVDFFLAGGEGRRLERVNFLWMGLGGFFRGAEGRGEGGKTLLIVMESSYDFDNASTSSNCNNFFFMNFVTIDDRMAVDDGCHLIPPQKAFAVKCYVYNWG